MTSILARLRLGLRDLLQVKAGRRFVLDEMHRLSIEDQRIAGVLIEITEAHARELRRLSAVFADLQARHHAQTLELERMGEQYAAAAIRIAALEKGVSGPR